MTRGGMKMSTTTKKSEQVKKAAVVKEEGYQVMPFVDTLWNQFGLSLDWAKELQESGEEAYLKTVKETIKVNKDFRNSFLNLYQESKRTNSEIVDSVSALYKKNDAFQIDFPELTDQFRDVSDRVENLALTPIKLSFDLMDRFDNNLVENSENYVHYVRERRNDLLKVTSDYVEIAKNNHKNIFSMIEKSVKVHVNN
jgi:Polyhydroxyalkanoic acid inclusion protein (PhaP_Bmeg)